MLGPSSHYIVITSDNNHRGYLTILTIIHSLIYSFAWACCVPSYTLRPSVPPSTLPYQSQSLLHNDLEIYIQIGFNGRSEEARLHSLIYH